MPRPCAVCSHESRAAIDQALLNGKTLSHIARTFGFTYTKGDGTITPDHKVIARHRDQCLPDVYQAAVAESKIAHGAAIANRLKHLDEQVDLVIEDVRRGDPVTTMDHEGNETPVLDEEGRQVYRRSVPKLRALLAAVREGRQNAELLGRLAGTLPEADQEELDRIRLAQGDPEARRLLADLDARLARAEPTHSGD